MSALAALLAQRIRAGGPLTVADYMSAVADHYYGTRDPFGTAGDFITAPEVSQMFGELIGLCYADLWQRLGAPDPVLLVELGPGRGTLLADALRATRIVPGFNAAIRLHLVERSPALRQKQAEKLGAFAPRWHDGIGTLPPGPLLLIANEFLDALPIRQFTRRGGRWHERRIALAEDGEHLAFALDPQPSLLAAHLPDGPEGAIAELAPPALALASALAARLRAEGGVALFIDYGYTRSACGDTLQALRRHQPQDVLASPGEADLTAHVDFQRFAEAARAAAAAVYGPVTQSVFLKRLGIEARAAKLAQSAPAQAEAIASACQRLIGADAMGSLFKVLALGAEGAPVPAGFDEAAG